MKSDDELRREFRAQHAYIAARTKRFLYLLPLLIGSVIYIIDGIGVKWSNEAGLFAIIGITVVTVLLTGTRKCVTCPKCSSRQMTRGFNFKLSDYRTCVSCGFVLVPEVAVSINPNVKFFQHKIRKGFSLAMIALGIGVAYLGHIDVIAHGIGTGIFIALFAILPHFGFFRGLQTCPKCENLNESGNTYCSHCGEMFS